jgi:hypothetical protein
MDEDVAFSGLITGKFNKAPGIGMFIGTHSMGRLNKFQNDSFAQHRFLDFIQNSDSESCHTNIPLFSHATADRGTFQALLISF